jgi:signal transduction histidine kinase
MRTTAELRRLRVRLTVLYTATAAAGLVALAVVTTTMESRLRAERADEELVGWASRAASLVDDAGERPDPAAIADDVIAARVEWAAFVVDDDELVQIGGRDGLIGAGELASQAVGDDDEVGTLGEVMIGGIDRRAAAMPIYVGDVAGGAVVVVARTSPDGGDLAWAVWIATGLLVVAGGVAGWFLAGRSIRPAAASLEHHEQFLSAAAHELRTPLARVRAVGQSAALSASGIVGDDAGRDRVLAELGRLDVLTSEAAQVVDQLLLIARVDAGTVVVRPEPVDLADVVVDLAIAHPTLATSVPPATVVTGDHALLRTAIANLVSNAERHGTVDGRPPAITCLATETEDRVELVVADDGPGIAPAVLPELFERFRSDDPTGTGVGLWLVRWIVEQHGGTVAVENCEGARITIVLPRPERDR